MAAPKQHTQIVRVPLTQEVREFLAAAPYWRRVTLVLPSEPGFYVQNDLAVASKGLDTEPDTPQGPGADRVYKLPPLDGDQQIGPFALAPGQTLAGATAQGASAITMIVEYVGGSFDA